MNFIGTYGADRATITVECSGKSDAVFTVQWGSSANEGSEWTMSGTLDTDTLTVNYDNCTKTDYVYENEDKRNDTVAYTNGKGSFTFDGTRNLTWNDAEEHVADGVTFTWSS